MKKVLLFSVTMLVLITLASCGDDDSYDSYDDDYPTEEVDNDDYDPADYDAEGNYKPVDEMTNDEIEEELTGMFEDALE